MESKRKFAAVCAVLLAWTALPHRTLGLEHAAVAERMSATQPVAFDIYLPVQHRDQLEKDLAAMHDPSSASYHKWLTPAEFHARYSVTSAQSASIVSELAAYGLQATATSPHRIHVTGSASAVERAFATVLKSGTYKNGKTVPVAVTGLAPTATMAATGAIVAGLSGTIHMESHARKTALPQNRYSPTGGYFFDDLKQAYSYPSYQAYTGKGVTIGILMSGGYNPADMAKYFAHEKLATPQYSEVDINGGAPYDPQGSFETHLDLQQSGGMAPRAHVVLYNIPDLSDDNIMAGLSQILEDNTADVVSMSFGGAEVGYTADQNGGVDYTYLLRAEDDLYAQGNAQGITFVASSGDTGAFGVPPAQCFTGVPNCGAYLVSVNSPASSPHVTGVGGTNLVTSYSAASVSLNSMYVAEEAFADSLTGDIFYGTSATGAVWGSGGGDSILFRKPLFQALTETGSPRFRTVPDLALHMGGCPEGAVTPCNPDDSFDYEVLGGLYYGVIGTSASAPDFAGLTALAVERYGRRLGNENYYIYPLALAQSAGLPLGVFRTGIPGFNGVYSTTPKGYNRVLGNGTVNGVKFLVAPLVPPAGTPQTPSNP